MNMLLGAPPSESYSVDPLSQATEAVWKAGIVVVLAGEMIVFTGLYEPQGLIQT